MFERFAGEARAVVVRAQDEARAAASPTIEAEHLLLALARDHPVLVEAGLDREAVTSALEDERRHSLAAVGVELDDFAARPPRPLGREPRFATSAKTALHRALEAATATRSRRIGPGQVLAGVLRAEVGTVARALALAGADREALADRAAASPH